MKKILYISYVDYKRDTDLGVVKKIEGQKKAFRNAGYQIDHLRMQEGKLCFNEEYVGLVKGKFSYWIGLPLMLWRWCRNNGGSYGLVYVRKDLIYLPLYALLFRRLKKMTPCLLLEIPTYPYEKDLGTAVKDKILVFLDKVNIFLIRHTIFRIVTTQEYERIWGIKTIQIRNGYDFSTPRQTGRQKLENTIRLVTVATFNYWHGLDRLLQGLYRYYQGDKRGKARVMLHVVGEGKELEGYRQLAADLKLRDVFFYGARYGEELDKIYEQSDVGVGALALYRRGSAFQSLLKNAEYSYYGLPFITGNPDKDLAGKPFVLEFPNNGSPLDIERLVDWYKHLEIPPSAIQQAGAALYSWEKQIDVIIKESKIER